MAIDSRATIALFKALADPTRLKILDRLSQREARVVDLMTDLGQPQSTVSGHLAVLREAGLVTGRTEGRQIFYALAKPEVLDLVTAADQLTLGASRRRLRK